MTPTRRRVLQGGSAIALLLVIVASFGYRAARAQANIGAGYVAHQICSCIFVAERSYESCLPDLLPVMDSIRSEVVEIGEHQGVRGWVPLLADRRAVHTPGRGCALLE